MDLTVTTHLKGIYSFNAVNTLTGSKRFLGEVADDHPNTIVTSGLDQISTGNDLMYHCCVGTDSTPTVMSMTSLGNQVAQTTTIQTNASGTQSSAPYFSWYRRTFRFAQGAAAGNLTEVGIKTGSGVLFSRALILDSAGQPTTLTILSDEYLDVTYEFRMYPDVNDVVLTVPLNGVNYTCTLRTANINSTPGYFDHGIAQGLASSNTTSMMSGSIGSVLSNPSGSSHTHGTSIVGSYVNGTYERTFNFSAGLNNANFNEGINSLYLRTSKGNFQVGFSPAIPKTSYMTLSLNLTVRWANYTI